MSQLISLDNVSLAFGLHPLLDKVKFGIEKGERVCLIGRNGAGKSSLMKVIAGSILPDSGTVWRSPGLRIACLSQELPQEKNQTVYDYVAQGLARIGDLLKEYHAITTILSTQQDAKLLSRMEGLHREIEAKSGWQLDNTIKTILTRLDLPADELLSNLSGGWQRRAALAQALVISPDLLLLDEPTNHLDITAIEWLEEQLISSGCGLLFITHDRALLQRLATRIIELDRGNLTSWPGDYANFLRRKEELLHAEEKHNADFDKKLAQEERWIRQGIKARRTRNEGRVRALKALRVTRAARREVQDKAEFSLNEADKSGQVIAEAKNASYSIGNKLIINNLSLRVMRGDKIGLIGPNGSGKTTLLSLLLGKLTPTQGEIKLGTNLQVAYFDQLRQALDPSKTVMENVAGGRESIEINGNKKHIISYLGDFLFTPERAMTPVKALSGGECNRLLLARLFSQPANLLVLDEPTNDLDMETLELLEELLAEFTGTLLLVSHDRAFIDDVVTSTLVFEGEGKVQEYVGGYQDWLAQRPVKIITKEQKTSVVAPTVNKSPSQKKLSYNEQRELNELPQKIEKLESEQQLLEAEIATPEFYKQPPNIVANKMQALTKIQNEIELAYKRWQDLLDDN